LSECHVRTSELSDGCCWRMTVFWLEDVLQPLQNSAAASGKDRRNVPTRKAVLAM
jgi:hypothetical protein